MSGDIHSKPRGDAVLKTLPEARQQEIIDKINTRGQTYTKVRAWLAQDGLQTNEKSLRDFYSWFNLRRRFERATARSLDVQQLLAEADPSLSPERIEAAGQMVFLNEAIETGDVKGFVSVSRLRLAKQSFEAEKDGFRLKYEQKEREIEQQAETLRLAREKFENAKFKVAEQTKKLREKGASISDEERLEIVRAVDQAMGIA